MRHVRLGAERLAKAPLLRAHVPGQEQVVLVRPTAVTAALTGDSLEYATFWENVYGQRLSPGPQLPIWADSLGRMRIFGEGNNFVPGGSAYVEVVEQVGVLIYVWVDGPPTEDNPWAEAVELPGPCEGDREVADAMLFGAAMGRWRRTPVYVIKAYIERKVGSGRVFFPPVWTARYAPRD